MRTRDQVLKDLEHADDVRKDFESWSASYSEEEYKQMIEGLCLKGDIELQQWREDIRQVYKEGKPLPVGDLSFLDWRGKSGRASLMEVLRSEGIL